jgi:hypothetical protein
MVNTSELTQISQQKALKTRKVWADIFQVLEANSTANITIPAKLFFQLDEKIKLFQNQQKLK